MLNRESGVAPGSYIVSHLERRGLLAQGSFSLTEAGRAALKAYEQTYQGRRVKRNFIGSGQ
jgi:hypothetical protein